ncbi:hypothetical protein EDC18_1013 [Natranaerovirga pectinivora]|uniref:Uncharacterized protein n=2 Tax=Natranaerovirga pectinivora TaxID=682400 RepID=A0A4R3MR98_9FIRM|nr:hypothetical protein EDC18_1013 [Natranaerovirga pectinivora]
MTTPNNEKNEKVDNLVTLDSGERVTLDEAINSVQNGYLDKTNTGSGKYEREYLRDEEKQSEKGRK